MSEIKGTSIRFSLLTVVIWLLVAGGVIFFLWELINRISAGNLPLSTPTPNASQVYQTIAAVLTDQPTNPPTAKPQTVTPSPTALLTRTPSSVQPSPLSTATPGMPTKTSTPAPLCNQAAAGNPLDVTIPDDSLIPAGQVFIKTWKLVNAGTCTWSSAYSASFFYGDRMDAPESVLLQDDVLPAQSVEISVEMVAPQGPGTYQGNWKLADASGTLFGIGPNGDSPFWVRIIVAVSLTATPTATPSATATGAPTGESTLTPTPEGQVSTELTPIPGDTIDLDHLILNGNEHDLSYQVDADQFHWLTPHEEAMIGVYGSQQPARADCEAANMSPAPIAVESLSTGTYLCYHTEEGRYGRMLFVALEPNTYALTLDLLTWAHP